jgi:hypothetical protein
MQSGIQEGNRAGSISGSEATLSGRNTVTCNDPPDAPRLRRGSAVGMTCGNPRTARRTEGAPGSRSVAMPSRHHQTYQVTERAMRSRGTTHPLCTDGLMR